MVVQPSFFLHLVYVEVAMYFILVTSAPCNIVCNFEVTLLNVCVMLVGNMLLYIAMFLVTG